MKQAKRMILVSEDVFNRFGGLETSPIASNMMRKDTETSKLLYREDLNDNENQKAYHANLKRYLDLKKQKDSTIPTVQLTSSSNIENKEKVLPPEKVQLSDANIVDNIPKTMRSRAVALLNRLKARPDVIS